MKTVQSIAGDSSAFYFFFYVDRQFDEDGAHSVNDKLSLAVGEIEWRREVGRGRKVWLEKSTVWTLKRLFFHTDFCHRPSPSNHHSHAQTTKQKGHS